eukprot:jgi/Psemu1/324528/estExt_fgenesh1_pg.C_1530020
MMWHPTIPRILLFLWIPIGMDIFASVFGDDSNSPAELDSDSDPDSTSHITSHRSDDPGKTPQMGWNPWNLFGCDINEKLVEEMAGAMVDSGLHDLGYNYINLDDCWQRSRNETGYIQEDPVLFPSGIASLAETIHDLGLLFGLYSDSGLLTCQGRPGGLGHEAQDAALYANWGVDYLKYDNCFATGMGRVKVRYQRMYDALVSASEAAGRPPFFFSLCEWGIKDPATWARTVGGNSWRTTGDIQNNWKSVVTIADANDRWHDYAGPGGWNDPDMLQVGTSIGSGSGDGSGLTLSEQRAHFTLWCLMKAPLLLANDLRSIPDEIWNIISNRELIAINQDPLGVQGYKRWSGLSTQTITARFQDVVDVGDFLRGSTSDGKRVGNPSRQSFAEQGTSDGPSLRRGGFPRAATAATVAAAQVSSTLVSISANVRDLWAHSDLGVHHDKVSGVAPSHDVVALRLTNIQVLSQNTQTVMANSS